MDDGKAKLHLGQHRGLHLFCLLLLSFSARSLIPSRDASPRHAHASHPSLSALPLSLLFLSPCVPAPQLALFPPALYAQRPPALPQRSSSALLASSIFFNSAASLAALRFLARSIFCSA